MKNTPNERRIEVGGDWSIPHESGVGRRTLVAGATWTVPVIAMAAATPAAAASLQPTLDFTNGPYSVDACGVLNNVVIQATTDGTTPSAGATVSVTLPDGLTWSDGSTGARSFTTDANGQVTLSGVRSTNSMGGTYPITAASGALTTSSTVTVTRGKATTLVSSSGLTVAAPNGLAITDLAITRRGDTTSGNPYYVVTLSDGTLWEYEEGGANAWQQRSNTGVDHVAIYGAADAGYLEATSSGAQLFSSSGVSQTTPNGLAITDLDVVRRDDVPNGNGYYLVTTSDGTVYSYEENTQPAWTERTERKGAEHVAAYEGAQAGYIEAYTKGQQLTTSTGITETVPGNSPITDIEVVRRDDESGGHGYYLMSTADGKVHVYEEGGVGWGERPIENVTQVAAHRRPGGAYLEAFAQIPACA